jgi:3-oxoacyl-[acyl-carrier-protein] synthase III
MTDFATVPGAAHTAILGLGAYRPSRVVPNADIIEPINSSDEWIQQRSGIKQRRFANEEETVQMMSVAASRTALERSGIDPAQVDGVIVATVSHLLQTPAVATAIAHELGLQRPVAFDISAACAGFCHALALASDMVRAGSAKYVLVIGVERLSDITDFKDRGTAFIFAGITANDLDVFVPHQANMRIIDAMARSMKLPERVAIARDIADQGNTSAASIPLALDRLVELGEAKSGDTALFIAFGAGLAYAAQVVKVP